MNHRLRIGKKKESKRHYTKWISGYVQPSSKFYKRLSSKKVRKIKGKIPNGCFYKKYWGWFEWC